MSTDGNLPKHPAVLVLPRIRVQNANAISSPMTWGFPAITAFTGLMIALERRLGQETGIAFYGVGVVCHSFEAQITPTGYPHIFHLTKPSVRSKSEVTKLIDPDPKKRQPPPIIEEGRVHLEVSLVFDVRLSSAYQGEAERKTLIERVAHELAGMRVAGGSVMPPLSSASRASISPFLELIPDGLDEKRKQFRRVARRCLPGFALVSRDDLLQKRVMELRVADPQANVLDAWLDLSRWNTRAIEQPPKEGDDAPPTVTWVTDARVGWLVPIPVGYSALSDVQPAGSVGGARDMETPFRFVESVWSMGQWVSPHRLKSLADLVWAPEHDPTHATEHGLYRCRNRYTPSSPNELAITAEDI